MTSSVGDRVAFGAVVGGLFLMFLLGLFGISDEGQTMAYVADTGDFAGYLHHGVEEDHWSVALGLWWHNLAN